MVEDGVVLIAATNHPSLLDPAVWRRFDKIVEFPKPTEFIRKRIFELSLLRIPGKYNIDELVKITDGFTGAEIKLVVREAVLKALIRGNKELTQNDLVEAVEGIKRRFRLRASY